MADWDADDFEPDVPATVTVPKVTDKWEGEDEDDDVKVTPFCLPFSLFLLWPVELHAAPSGDCEGYSCLGFLA